MLESLKGHGKVMNKLIALLVVVTAAATFVVFIYDTWPKRTVRARLRYGLRSLRLLSANLIALDLGNIRQHGLDDEVWKNAVAKSSSTMAK